MARVFVSYAHRQPDESLAQEVASALSKEHQVFIDTAIAGGRNWGEVIEQELHTADFIVPFLSSESIERPMVVAEIAAAHELNVKFGRPRIVPIRLDSAKLKYPLTAYVSRFQELSWGGPDDSARLLNQTLRALDEKPVTFSHSPERHQMIQRVRADWIDGILRKSLFEIAPISPMLKPQPHAIEHRLDAIIQRPDEEPVPLGAGTKLASVFDDHLGQLLILGAPGSGKTTLLLNLARDLLDRAETDIHQPIPVVFNLSSWADRRLPLEDWLTDELRLRSDVPREIARRWVREDQLLLLLDGLDEVAAAYRDACVEAINTYRTGHGFVRIAVCSRVAEYEQLTARLRLPAAILILPLSQSLVLQYLGEGTPLDGVRTAVEADPGLWALLETPLTLSIVAIVGGNLARDSAARDRSAAETRDQLFAYYVDAMFKRRSKDRRYTRDQMQHWLTCLALMLVRREQSIFRIEDLRRNWLETRTARIGVLLVISFIVALISAIFAICLISATDATSLSMMFENPFVTRIVFPIFMTLGFLLTLFRGGSIRIVDLVEVRWPGLPKMLRATLEGAILGGVLGFLSGWVGCTLNGGRDGKLLMEEGLYWAKIGGLAFGLGKAIDSLAGTRELEIRPSPNFALFQSLRNTIGYTSISLIFSAAGIILFRHGYSGNDMQRVTSIGIVLVGWVSLFFGMEKGGYFLLDHYATRFVLWRKGRIPWNYLRFLDTAAERVFLRRLGSGYIFVHRMLLDYFARRETTTERRKERGPRGCPT